MALQRLVTTGLARRLFGADPARTLALLRAAWPRAVGPDLARRTEVVALEAATLRVRVPDARWRKELHRLQAEILRRLREIAGDLAPWRLGFMEGPVAAPTVAKSARIPEESSGPPLPPAGVVAGAAVISDPDVRERFLEAAARYLERSKGGSRHA